MALQDDKSPRQKKENPMEYSDSGVWSVKQAEELFENAKNKLLAPEMHLSSGSWLWAAWASDQARKPQEAEVFQDKECKTDLSWN